MSEEFEKYVRAQFDHGREHFADLKKAQDIIDIRLGKLERAKIYAEGFKTGAVWAIGFAVASIIGAAVYIMGKMTGTPTS